MPETPEDFHRRVAAFLRMPPVKDWDTFPFDGEMRPRALRPPLAQEIPRSGQGGTNCKACAAPESQFFWTDRNWRLQALPPSGLPMVLILDPRLHLAEPGDLPAELASELGLMLSRVERAVRAVDGIGRVHVCRWGDGSEHLHWWFLGRPARIPQLIGSFAAIWDDVLPPTPENIWRENVAIVARELNRRS